MTKDEIRAVIQEEIRAVLSDLVESRTRKSAGGPLDQAFRELAQELRPGRIDDHSFM